MSRLVDSMTAELEYPPGRTLEQAIGIVMLFFPNKLDAHNWAMSWENLFMPYANNKGADQPAHPHLKFCALAYYIKPTEKMFSEWTKGAAMDFSMVCVMLQAVYTTAEKEFRTIVFLIFDASCWHKKAPICHKRWNNMIIHPVHYKGKGLQSWGLF